MITFVKCVAIPTVVRGHKPNGFVIMLVKNISRQEGSKFVAPLLLSRGEQYRRGRKSKYEEAKTDVQLQWSQQRSQI